MSRFSDSAFDDSEFESERQKGVPFQSVNQYRSEWLPPDLSPHDDSPKQISESVMDAIRNVFGIAGMRSFLEIYPYLRYDIEASVREARAEGAWDEHLRGATARSNESWKSIGRMVSALVQTPEGATDTEIVVRGLAAHAGLDDVDVDTIGKRVRSEGLT